MRGAGLPDGVGEVDTLPGFYRKSVELQDRVSLAETGLMSRTACRQQTSDIRLSCVMSPVASQTPSLQVLVCNFSRAIKETSTLMTGMEVPLSKALNHKHCVEAVQWVAD